MKIGHLAIWTFDLERMKEFYQKYFDMNCSKKYENVQKGFSSYFLSFEDGAQLEIMSRKDNSNNAGMKSLSMGLAHFAISVGSNVEVDNFTERLRNDGIKIIGEPRTTGDGYYESVILDPEGNHVEITE